ncbi:MAG: hypothetical protein C0607_15705 [Azoarcus sp.]|nr:MAG: hypothetical protein C0607_15705 [Azoarcus sp.]TVT58383.1 MAG: hypothetical protein FHK80_07265 [Azoarcus sp. PHD]
MSAAQIRTDILVRVEEAATDILTLVEGLSADDFARSRLTRTATLACLREIADAASALPAEGRAAMPEVDWAGWLDLGDALANGVSCAEREWQAASEGAAVILQWMRVYRRVA